MRLNDALQRIGCCRPCSVVRSMSKARRARGQPACCVASCAPLLVSQQGAHVQTIQLSMARRGTRANSRVLLVASGRLIDRACAAIHKSFGPMGFPNHVCSLTLNCHLVAVEARLLRQANCLRATVHKYFGRGRLFWHLGRGGALCLGCSHRTLRDLVVQHGLNVAFLIYTFNIYHHPVHPLKHSTCPIANATRLSQECHSGYLRALLCTIERDETL